MAQRIKEDPTVVQLPRNSDVINYTQLLLELGIERKKCVLYEHGGHLTP